MNGCKHHEAQHYGKLYQVRCTSLARENPTLTVFIKIQYSWAKQVNCKITREVLQFLYNIFTGSLSLVFFKPKVSGFSFYIVIQHSYIRR